MQYLEPVQETGEMIPNIALMLERNELRFANKIVFAEKHNGVYEGVTWQAMMRSVRSIAANLQRYGFGVGDKMMIYSPNRLEMLELELAVMAMGGISVPIFAWFGKETAELLIHHSDTKFLTVSGEFQLSRLSESLPLKHIFVFDHVETDRFANLVSFSKLLEEPEVPSDMFRYVSKPDDVCLNMYTSGTMGIPKCVQLTHGNILSQQAALSVIWKLDENDRFLSYLPWHHSFGGIFERFSALYNGATMYLESGYGKDPKVIMENWKLVRPTLFFSVPKVYQSLIGLTKIDSEAGELFFHSSLKFIFTAAASLPNNLSEEFAKRGIPVVEGWGLTETSPCCTLTDPQLPREPGVVGRPIPGVHLRLADDGEIQVKGPNVMKGYYKNEEANVSAFTEDGWYCTGDIGEFTPLGLKLISRKDRIFKLSNGEKVIPSEMEGIIQNKCHYITFALVVGGGKEFPVALLFPNKKNLDHPNYELSPEDGCFCPRSLDELGKCLHGCLNDANCGLNQKFAKVKYAMVVDDELSIDKQTLTPSMKPAMKNVMEAYKGHIENLYGGHNQLGQDVYIIKLETANQPKEKAKDVRD